MFYDCVCKVYKIKIMNGVKPMSDFKDLSAQLPNGEMFEFWEVEPKFERELHVDCNHPDASDDNDGSKDRPFKTINAAAQAATGNKSIDSRGCLQGNGAAGNGRESPKE